MVSQGDVGAHDQVANGPGGQDVPGLGGRHHPRRDVDGDPADVAVAELNLAGVQPRPELDADASQLISERAAAQRIARPGPSKVASIPSPVVLISWPPNSSTSRRATSSWTLSSSRQRRSPSRLACPVEPTMSVNSTVASTRVGAAIRRTPVRKASIWSEGKLRRFPDEGRVGPGKLDQARLGDVLGEVAAMLGRDVPGVPSMHDQGWRLDQRQGGADIDLQQRPQEPLGGSRAGPGANQLPRPAAKPLVAGAAGRHHHG
jgi:hypothetical protein